CLHSFNHSLDCNCESLEIEHSIKYLGVFLDSTCSMKTHILYVCKKLRRAAFALRRLTYLKLPHAIIRQVYFCLAESHINYCIESWGFVSETSLRPIQYLQNEMMRILFKSTNQLELIRTR